MQAILTPLTVRMNRSAQLDSSKEDVVAEKETVKHDTLPTLDFEQGEAEFDELPAVDIAWKYKWLALLCVVVFPIGQNCRSCVACRD